MSKLIIPFVITIMVFTSCNESSEEHLPKDKMVKIMTDIHLAEVYSTMVNDSLQKSVNKNMDSLAWYYKSILDHHGVTIDQYKNSIDWYSSHPLDFDSVYVALQDELIKIEGVLNSQGQNNQ